MTNKFFFICLLTGLLCAYCEYYWMKNGYRSLAIVASKCPKPSMSSTQTPIQHVYQMKNSTVIESISNWFANLFATNKDKQIVPTVCQTFEIHTDPRSIFVLIKTLCLLGLTMKLVSSLKTLPNLLRTTKNNPIGPSKGDGFVQQTKLFETTNGKLGTLSSMIDRRNLSIR